MKMNYAEWVCPKCKTKNRETCNMWMYGSPIRECKACRSEYLDRRWREVAIDGFDPRSKNAKFYAKGAAFLLSLAIAWHASYARYSASLADSSRSGSSSALQPRTTISLWPNPRRA